MFGSNADHGGTRGSSHALVGLAGAVLACVGDVLILGRPCSGRDFDKAAGLIPPNIDVEDRWRSLWNGAVLPSSRIRGGTITGVIGIGVLAWFGLRGATQAIEPGVRRTTAIGSVAAFAVAGVLTHWSCGSVVLAYRQALRTAAESRTARWTSPRSSTRLLGVSAVASLTALAVLSVSLTLTSPQGRDLEPIRRAAVTPLPWVAATLATFGVLPAPIGGYARPASISIGLTGYLSLLAVSTRGDRVRPASHNRPGRGRRT